jgi:hypothetical protein
VPERFVRLKQKQCRTTDLSTPPRNSASGGDALRAAPMLRRSKQPAVMPSEKISANRI